MPFGPCKNSAESYSDLVMFTWDGTPFAFPTGRVAPLMFSFPFFRPR